MRAAQRSQRRRLVLGDLAREHPQRGGDQERRHEQEPEPQGLGGRRGLDHQPLERVPQRLEHQVDDEKLEPFGCAVAADHERAEQAADDGGRVERALESGHSRLSVAGWWKCFHGPVASERISRTVRTTVSRGSIASGVMTNPLRPFLLAASLLASLATAAATAAAEPRDVAREHRATLDAYRTAIAGAYLSGKPEGAVRPLAESVRLMPAYQKTVAGKADAATYYQAFLKRSRSVRTSDRRSRSRTSGSA